MSLGISLNTVAVPLGFVAAGQAIELWGVTAVFTALPAGITWPALLFASVALRHREDGEVAGLLQPAA